MPDAVPHAVRWKRLSSRAGDLPTPPGSNQQTGGFTRTELATGIAVHEGNVGDINGDGRPDLVCKPYNWDAPRVDLWLNEG